MDVLSTNRLGAFALIAGPLIAFIPFLFQPGGMFIDPASTSDASGLIDTWRANEALSKATGIPIVFGLMLMAFGIYEVHVAHRGSRGDGLNMAGLAFMSLGIVAWIFAQALSVTLSGDIVDGDAALGVFYVRLSLVLSGGAAVSLGAVLFSLGILAESQTGAFKWLSWLAVLAGVVGTVCWVVALFDTSSMDDMARIARSMYIIFVVWMSALGIRLGKEEPAS